MSNSNNTSDGELPDIEPDLAISFAVRFWIFLFSDILSTICSLFVLYYLLFIRKLRRSLNNHTIIVLLSMNLIYNLTNIPFITYYYRLDGVWQVTLAFSLFWSFLDYGISTTLVLVFAWSTIEKHIIIFHDRWLLRKKKRFYLHYLPLIILLLYGLIYHSLVIFYPFCEYSDDQSTINGVFIPCMYINPTFNQCDLIIHQIVPTFIIIISTIGLLVRVLRQKKRLRQPIQWRKQRKLTIQVLSISFLYLCFQFPWAFVEFGTLVGIPVDPTGNILNHTYFFGYYVGFLFPFVCCGSLTQLRKKVKKLFCWQRQLRAIVPEPIK